MKLAFGSACLILGSAFLYTGAGSAKAAVSEHNSFVTNKLNRWITNFIEVTVPDNRFINLYQTNWVVRTYTNVVDVYATNVLARTVTNEVFRTAYRTNYKTLNFTNWESVVVYQTNWTRQPKTNFVVIQAYVTNLVSAYQTNYRTLNFTNWLPVVVMRTNWVNRPATNVVEIDVVTEGVTPAPTASAGRDSISAGAPGAVLMASDLVIEADRSNKVLPNGGIEVLLRVSGRGNQPVRVQQWRVESEDGSILCFGQEANFKRALAVGRYKVEVRARKEAVDPLLISRGVLVVTSQEVQIQPRPLALK